MLKPSQKAWQDVVNYSFKLTILTAAMASIGVVTGCSSAPQKTTVTKTGATANADLLDADGLDSLENLLYATDMRAVEGDRLAILRHGDVWKRMTVGFKLNLDIYNPRIDAQRAWFATRQPYLDRLSARASRYLYYTVKEAERRGIPTELALLPVLESSYDPAATSTAAAAGLWQFIPSTGKIYGLRQSALYDGRRDVVESTRAAYEYLSGLYNQFGTWELALASYNAGPGRIQQAINRNKAAGLPTDYWSLKLPSETMNYVPRFLAVAQIIKNPDRYGVNLPAIANRPHFREVQTPGSIDLNQLASITGISRGELYALNPGHRGNYTDPLAPRRILIPNEVNLGVDAKIAKMNVQSGTGGLWTGTPAPPAITGGVTSVTSRNGITQNQASKLPNSAAISTTTASNRTNISSSSVTKQNTPKGAQALANFAANADVPSAPRLGVSITPSKQIKPINIEPPISEAEKQAIIAENNPPIPAITTSAANNATTESTLPPQAAGSTAEQVLVEKLVEPKPSEEERNQVIRELERIAPKGTEIIDPLDGKIKLTAIQSSQSIAEQKGEEVKIGYAYPKAVTEVEVKAKSDMIERNKGKPVMDTPNDVMVVAPKGKREIYTIQSGDTLATIAAKFAVSWRDIAAWNQINADKPLYVGSRLYIYDAKPVQDKPAKPEKHVVKAGENLTQLARQYNVSLADLAAWNNLTTSSNLLVGQSLYLAEPKNLKTSDSSTKKSESDDEQSVATQIYTVKRGEYLKLIADRYHLSTGELAALNKNMSATSNLIVGQKIKVPKQKIVAEPSSSSAVSYSSTQDASVNTTLYTVTSGDYLSSVAKKYNMSLSDLAQLNDLKTTSAIRVGQKLKVITPKASRPTTYRVQSGDSLNSVAQKFEMSVQQLAAANKLKTTSMLNTGALLKLDSNSKIGDTDTTAADQTTDVVAAASTRKIKTESYKVKANESLTSLAKRYTVSVAELASLNNLSVKASLQRGQTIQVPISTVNYTVKRGDSLIALAKKYAVSTEELAKMNNLKIDSQLQSGQTLRVPNM